MYTSRISFQTYNALNLAKFRVQIVVRALVETVIGAFHLLSHLEILCLSNYNVHLTQVQQSKIMDSRRSCVKETDVYGDGLECLRRKQL